MHTKQTKIICTIAHNRCEPEFIRELYDAGMNVARFNTAHITIDDAEIMLKNIRDVSDRIGVLIDTKGPEVRICNLEEDLEVQTGAIIHISAERCPEGGFQVNYEGFISEIPVGSDLLIDDGDIQLNVTDKTNTELICTASNDGVIKNRKSVNVPRIQLNMPALTEKDAEFIDWATRSDIEFIAHSFVRNRDDVMAVQSILDMRKSPIKIIAKIENREGVDNLDSILDVAYGLMVARGDLGIEIPAEEVPITQKLMIKTCIARVKPVITATQMLHSMIDNPRATRAEVSDVANAIYDGTDALMLSGETAYGKYPIESVQTMANIAKNVEAQIGDTKSVLPVFQQAEDLMPRNYIARSAVHMAAMLPSKAIITSTKSGDTAQICASYRGKTPIFAFSLSNRTVRELSLTFGVQAQQSDIPPITNDLVKKTLRILLDDGVFTEDDYVVYIGGGQVYAKHTNFLQVDTAITLLKE
ncbi:MAG: pyruvate kinase [Pontiella sp.]